MSVTLARATKCKVKITLNCKNKNKQKTKNTYTTLVGQQLDKALRKVCPTSFIFRIEVMTFAIAL